MRNNLKLYSQKAITIATFFGGPLAAGVLVRRNSLSLGREREAVNSLVIGIISTILLIAISISLPDYIFDKIPNILIPAIYTAIIHVIVYKVQGKALQLHKENNGEFYSGWKATGVGAICLVIISTGVFGYVMATETKSDFNVETYVKEILLFSQNEDKTFAIMDLLETSASDDVLIKEFSEGVAIGEENIEIINRINAIENLPPDIMARNEKFTEYCNLRIRYFEMIIKAISENTAKYNSQANEIAIKIEKLIEESN